MDKVFTFRTFVYILAFIVISLGFFTLGRGVVNVLDLTLVIISLITIARKPQVVRDILGKNRVYFLLSGAVILSVILSGIYALNKWEVFKNFIQFSAYLFLTPIALTSGFDLKKHLRITFLILSPFVLMYSLLFFCTPKPVRLTLSDIHPNALGYIFALLSVLNVENPLLYTTFAFLTSLTFSRASMLSLFLATLIFAVFKREKRFLIFSAIPLFFMVIMSQLISLYKESQLCRLVQSTIILQKIESSVPVDIRLVRIYDFDRIRIWESALKMFLKSPIFGVGSGNFNLWAKDMCDKGELNKAQCYASLPQKDAHNMFIGFLAETGMLGFLSILSLLGFIFVKLLSIKDSEGLVVFILSIFISFLHPPVFFTRYMGILVWYILLGKVLNYTERIIP
ncbi:MAG: O-antigen ligase family protein [candidate division WOR-3 bacterium]